MRRRISPCYNCERRTLGCHSVCEDYRAYTAENIAVRETIREIYNKNDDINAVEFGTKAKMIKKYGRQK